MFFSKPRRGLAVLGALVLTVTVAPAANAHRGHDHAHDHAPEVIASGLDNPRGLGFGPDGSLYVAESGAGGAGPCFVGPEGPACFGKSGAVTRIDRRGQRRVLDRLSSYGAEGSGDGAIGPSDVAFRDGRMYVTVGLGLDLDQSKTIPELGDMGQLIVAKPGHGHGHGHRHGVKPGGWKTVVDLADFEDANNPTGDEENVNPNAVISTRRGLVVSDAGANDLLAVSRRGDVSVLATFPNTLVDAPPFLGLPPGTKIPMDAVPTSVTQGPRGALYVGQLTGFPFPVGGASVFRVARGQVETVATGFTNIIDVGFDSDGTLYVLEIFANGLLSGDPTGALIRVADDGSQEVVMSEGLTTPGGMVIRGHHAYVSNCGTCAGGGEVLKIHLH